MLVVLRFPSTALRLGLCKFNFSPAGNYRRLRLR
jgi:hypothetical protein